MSPWTSLYIPLMKGLDLSKEESLGGDELHLALNTDWGPDGTVKGRPSRAAANQFYVLDPAYSASDEPTYKAAAAFSATGFTASGLLRVKDGAGERPALATQGRLFMQEGTKWHDRGAFGCMRVDRVNGLPDNRVVTAPDTMRRTMAPDFGHAQQGVAAPPQSEVWALFNSAGALEQRDLTPGMGTLKYGTGTQKYDTNTLTWKTAVVAVDSATNNLEFFTRNNGAATLTANTLATDARTPVDVGDAPVICPAASGNAYFVAYRTTAANGLKVLRIDMEGIVEWTYSVTPAGLTGIWVDNTAGNVCLAFTDAAGLTVRQLNPATGAAVGADATDTTGAGADCVVGVESTGQAWYAYRMGTDEAIVVGYVNLSAATTAVQRIFRGRHSSGAVTNAWLRWGICHQPVRLNGRMYLSLACASANAYTATWLTLDLTNWRTTAALSTGPFSYPTIVARGPTAATYPHLQPCPAVAMSDATGFVFPTQDWQTFAAVPGQALTGLTAQCGMNRVTLSKPRCASLGESVVFSGSVPRMIGRGDCVELGWPFLSGEPGLEVEAVAGGAIPPGDYSVQACWKWTDEAGQVHRSAPSQIRTVTVAAGLRCHVTWPWLTEKPSRVVVEVYVNSLSATSTYRLQATSTWSGFSSEPSATVTLTALSGTTEQLYSDGDTLPNYHVPGDGGVTAVGRRLWLAGPNQVYASKLWTPGLGPEFNDDAAEDQPSLFINIPANAGRVVSLEALDDKLVVFCERGIYLVQDGGPSNTGLGADFAPPLRVSDLSIAGPRSSCMTDYGVVFCTSLSSTDPARGGPWLIDRQFTFTERQFLGRAAERFYQQSGSWVPEVAYAPERQQLYITTWRACTDAVAVSSPTHGVVVFDLRQGKWCVWDLQRTGSYGNLQSITCVSGVLWALNSDPAAYSGAPGTDAGAGSDYAMQLWTAHLSADGRDGAGWSRVRSVTPVEAEGTGAHSLTMTAVMDKTRTLSSGAISLTAPVADTTWPTTRQAPEWRLPSQKCSTLQVQLSCSPATARWSAIRLDVAPLPRKAPAKNRS